MDVGNDYKEFDPKTYLQQYYYSPREHGDRVEFDLQQLHHIFNSGKVNGKYLLDIGTGPSIHSIISASCHVDEIVLSDYAEQNRVYLYSWWKGQTKIQEKLVKMVLAKEEKGEFVRDRTKLMKQKVKHIVPVDITRSSPLTSDRVRLSYDIIISSGCFDAVALTKEQYCSCLSNIRPLLKQGGHLIILGDINESYYMVGKVKYTSLEISSADLKAIYKENGFEIAEWKEFKRESTCDEEYDGDGSFFMVAKKT